MKIREHEFDFNNETYICAILNVTPDSFSDGGKNIDPESALRRALEMEEEGASIIDVGGESTRPGYTPVDEEEEIRRVVPVIKAIREKSDVVISIDTMKASVAKAAVEAGADIVNDVSGLLHDAKMAEVIRSTGACCVITHNQNYVNQITKHQEENSCNYVNNCNERHNKIMNIATQTQSYVNRTPSNQSGDMIDYVNSKQDITSLCMMIEYRQRLIEEMNLLAERALDAGIERDRIILDPGVGFKGLTECDYAVLSGLGDFTKTGWPILLGTSRKSCIAALCLSDNKKNGAFTALNLPPYLGDKSKNVTDDGMDIERNSYVSIADRDLGTLVTSVMAVQCGVGIIRVHDVAKNVKIVKITKRLRRS